MDLKVAYLQILKRQVALRLTSESIFGGLLMIDRLYKLDINGAGQWFLERGSADARHMVLFVHGGPGSAP